MTTVRPSRSSLLLILGLGVALFAPNVLATDPPSVTQNDNIQETRKKPVPKRKFDTLAQAIAHAEDELLIDYSRKTAAIVYSFTTPDDQPVIARTKLQYVGKGRGGYRPGKASTSEYVLLLVFLMRITEPVELHIVAPGFEKHIGRAILRPGGLTIWNDIVLEPITARSGASVAGRVWLEDEDASVEGLVIYVDDEAVAFTDADGDFFAHTVRAGELFVSSKKQGYVGLVAKVHVAPGHEQSCELFGYRRRFARVRWIYQPNGTRDFEDGIRSGTAVLTPGELSRVSFAKGFKNVNRASDFYVIQRQDRLLFYHVDGSSGTMPGSMRIKETSLDELTEAPKSGYVRLQFTLVPGDLYVFRGFGGKHYGMMEVLDVTDERPSPE